VEIRRLGPDDWERYRRIRLASLRDAPDAFGSTADEALSRIEADWRAQLDGLATFVAVIDGSDVGTVRGGPDDEDPETAYLLSMWVAPANRGAGVGDRLVATVIAWARSTGFTRLVLDVADHNEPARSLYRRSGFQPTGETGSLPPPRSHIREQRLALSLRPA